MEEKISRRTKGSRYFPKRYDFSSNVRDAILDEGLICHVSFQLGGQPYLIPTGYCRVGDTLYLHGSVGSHFFMQMAKGLPVCVCVTLLDGLMLARSIFNHSMNYRSVVAFGQTRLVESEDERWLAAERFTEHVIPGRWADARKPTASDMKKTIFIAIEIEEASVKFRTNGVSDAPEDMELPVWAGVLPLYLAAAEPQTDSQSAADILLPAYLKNYSRG